MSWLVVVMDVVVGGGGDDVVMDVVVGGGGDDVVMGVVVGGGDGCRDGCLSLIHI